MNLRKFHKSIIILSVVICSGAVADDFVPFVIAGRPNPDSLIAAAPGESIDPDSERLAVRSAHFARGDQRVRLWGVNLSFGANFPKKEDAPYVAARLAAAGVNTVRCHHMDTSRWPRGLWNARDGKTIEPEALDRLDFFIDQLARRGIYVDMNLHVGRAHSEYLNLPKTNRQYDKITNIFTPALIDAQKQFARELLTHVNPYRKVRYADDPAVAIVEITNENSFFMWSSEETLRTLPPYYADILQKQFNVWLHKKYGSNEKLRAAWAEGAEPLGRNLLTNGAFRETSRNANIPSQWNLEQHSGCKASTSRCDYQSKDALQIKIVKSDDTEWHLQLTQGGFPVKEGQYYSVIFDAAAEQSRRISCSVSQAHDPWSNLGLSRQAELTTKWQSFRFGFVARADDDNARVSFAFGGSDVPICLANVEFRPGGRLGLGENESMAAGSVRLYADNESPQRVADRMCFLAETEKQYFDGMRTFIKHDLGCKALVTGTIVFGPLGLYAQSDMDFIDSHAYWQHPRFPGRPWDSGNWLVNQKPMTDYPAEATLFRIAAERLAGKPFTVTEYNHPAPLDSQAACVPMMASFAAAQDWDGIWFYTYSHGTDDWYRENMSSYFDIDTNPAKWGFMRAGAAIFRDNGIEHLDRFESFGLCESSEELPASLERLHRKYDRNMATMLENEADIRWRDMLDTAVSLTFGKSREGKETQPGREDKLEWSVENGKGLYVARGDAGVLVGHTSRLARITDDIRIDNPSYAVMTITSLDGKSVSDTEKILITVCGRCENTGMKFSRNRQTVGRNWGEAPVQIEAVTGTMTLPPGQWKCKALGPDGTPRRDVPVSNGVIKLSPEYGTMWYLLTR
ncbi:MAG: carbohydrate binding domain-containing protein [Sedimentisphaerales bacterium]|nr:carbohydrate binding domain-containing protein [Sedimentisphaerales bacterium]